MLADSYDLATLGFTLRDVLGLGGLVRDLPVAKIPGRIDSVALGEPQSRPRTITLIGMLSVATMADLEDLYENCDELRWRLERDSVQLSFSDLEVRYGGETRYFNATLLNPEEIRIPPAFNQRMRELRLQFVCPDPVAYATTETTTAFSSTPVEIELGSAPSYPVITLTDPPLDIDLIVKDADGVEVARLSLVDLYEAGIVVVDMRWQSITIDGLSAPETLVGTTDFFALDPRWATSLAGPWATLQTSVACTASETHRNAWR
jgi:hypothetical protein